MARHRDSDEYSLFIDGVFTESTGSDRIEGEYLYDGTGWASVPDGTAEDVDRTIEAAANAYNEWKETSPSERRAVLFSIADALDEHAEELGELETRQNGKLVREMKGEASILGEHYRYYGGLITVTGVTWSQ